jgi:hypothetical protein
MMVDPLLVDSVDAEIVHGIEVDLDGLDGLYGLEDQDIALDLAASDGSDGLDGLNGLVRALHAGAVHAA